MPKFPPETKRSPTRKTLASATFLANCFVLHSFVDTCDLERKGSHKKGATHVGASIKHK